MQPAAVSYPSDFSPSLLFNLGMPKSYLSSSQKRKKRKIEQEFIKSETGALDKFIQKHPHPHRSNVDEQDNADANVEDVNVNNVDANVEDVNVEGDNVNDKIDANVEDVNENVEKDDVDPDQIDIFDPRNWGKLDQNMINILVAKGPKQDLNIEKTPKDKFGRPFTTSLFTRKLPSKETCNREWLVYSKEHDKVFCFCCKLFRSGIPKGGLNSEGFRDWQHASRRLKAHERGLEHMKHMTTWFDMRKRLEVNKTIDKVSYNHFQKERDYWQQVILRIIALVKFLATHGLAFRGSNEKLYQKSNGNFLGLIEMLEDFDPIMKEHVRRIMNDELQVHYLGHNIQNKLILSLANQIKTELIKKIKQAKYYSIILDCTPDTSHQEQLSLIVRYVDFNSTSIKIEESFLGFLVVGDPTGKGLFDVTLEELNCLGLDIGGQGYDNGSNMKGKNQGVQKRFLDINPRAFYTACGCHSLNLVLCDMDNTCTKSRNFFGLIQRLYTIFVCSTKRWDILEANVKGLTLKSLSTTRWESRVDSVKPIRFQLVDVREALLEVGETDNDLKIQSGANSLAKNDISDFEFLVSIVIWYEILSTVNVVSKKLQSNDMVLDVAIEEVKQLIEFFRKYREEGLAKAIDDAKQIEMDVDPKFPQRRPIRRRKQFDEASTEEEVLFSAEEDFKINYFLFIVDQALTSLENRFEQL